MKVRHYYNFERNDFKELNKSKWDMLRTEKVSGPFSIERVCDKYENNCEASLEYKEAAREICEIIAGYKSNGKRLVSLGCGKGIVEWHIKKMMPNLYLKCTDYAREGLELLEKVFVECDEFCVFDMLKSEDYKVLKKDDIVLMYRISTEFTLSQWKSIFSRLYDVGIDNIIFVPTEIMTIRIALNEKKRQFMNWIRGKENTFCGWLYSYDEYPKIFRGIDGKAKYEIVTQKRIKDTIVFELRKG